MNNRVMLITEQPEDLWCQIVSRVLSLKACVECVAESRAPELLRLHEYNLAILDSTSISAVSDLIKLLLHSQAGVPVVVMAASPNWREARDAFVAGASDYLSKTYNERELYTILNHLLRS